MVTDSCDSSCYATIEILSSDLYSPTLSHIMILASKHPKCPNFNEARKWLLIAFCYEIPLLQIAIVEVMTSIICQSFMRCGQVVYTTCWCPHKIDGHASYNDLFSHSCFKASTKLKQLNSTCIVVNCHQSKLYDESSNLWFGIVIQTSSTLG